MSDIHDWTDSRLWRALEECQDPHAEACRTTLHQIMPDIQSVLVSGGTAPKDFTLHDAGHSFRVARNMFEIARESMPILSSYELLLLFLAAYLHDIGMTPEYRKVNGHYGYLLTGDVSTLTDEERSALQPGSTMRATRSRRQFRPLPPLPTICVWRPNSQPTTAGTVTTNGAPTGSEQTFRLFASTADGWMT